MSKLIDANTPAKGMDVESPDGSTGCGKVGVALGRLIAAIELANGVYVEVLG